MFWTIQTLPNNSGKLYKIHQIRIWKNISKSTFKMKNLVHWLVRNTSQLNY
jgi:hypothetical protein